MVVCHLGFEAGSFPALECGDYRIGPYLALGETVLNRTIPDHHLDARMSGDIASLRIQCKPAATTAAPPEVLLVRDRAAP